MSLEWVNPPNPDRLRGIGLLGSVVAFGFILSGVSQIQAFGAVVLALSGGLYASGKHKDRKTLEGK